MMAVESFLRSTETRIPEVDEMIALCDELGISFRMVDARPALRFNGDNKAEAELLAKLFKREPFRSRVIAARINGNVAAITNAETCPVCDGTVFMPHEDNGCDKPKCPYPVEEQP